ncbi:MAG: fluoride efflux transporter CrcB [Haloechinothrix sp.]
MTIVAMLLGGALGANLRYLTDRRVQRWHDSTFPWGTLTVNVIGSLIMGFLAGAALYGLHSPALHVAVGTGFSGALTTYSTFGYETFRLFAEGARAYSIANIVTSVLAGLGAAVCGILLAAAVLA